MFNLLKKKNLSEKFMLEEILSDIRNIVYVNTNAALSQLRTFIERLCTAVLIYENINEDVELNLDSKIKEISSRRIFSEELCLILDQIRRTGNKSVHEYYKSTEEAIVYLESCEKILEQFQIKYESSKVEYNNKLVKKYSKTNVVDKQLLDEEYFLLNGEKVISPKVNIDIYDINQFELMKQKMLHQIKCIKKIMKELDISNNDIEIVEEKLKNNTFNIVVLGEVNRGKSTLINALIGENILPSNILPTTSVITKVLDGEKKKAIIYFEDESTKVINVENLKEYVTDLQKESIKKIKNTEVFYPNDICKHKCVIVDTPGVNDINDQNTEVTYKYIPHADVIIFLMDPDQVLTKSEKEFIQGKILNGSSKKIFFVLNKSDNLNTKTLESLKNYITNVLKEINVNANFDILSSKRALIAKMEGEKNHYLDEFISFENKIKDFLVSEKCNQVLFNNATRINSIAKYVINYIYTLNQNTKIRVEELDELKRKALKNSEILNNTKNDIFDEIDGKYNLLKNKLIDLVNTEMGNSFQNLIDRLSNMNQVDENTKVELEGYINRQVNGWIKSRVNPLLVSELNTINRELVELVNRTVLKINGEKESINGLKYNSNIVIESNHEVSSSFLSNTTNVGQGTFIGVGAIITMLASGSLFGGVIGAFLGKVLFNEMEKNNCYDNSINQTDSIIKSIRIHRAEVINEINKSIINNIDENYNKNKEYIHRKMLETSNANLKVIENIQKQISESEQDKKQLDKKLDNFLKQLIIINNENNDLIKYLE